MDKIKKIFDKRIFLTAFFATMFIHGEMIFNKISFHDDLDTLFDGWTNSIRHGRWMYRFLSLVPEKFAGMESIPVVIGIIVAACIGLMACILLGSFRIEKYITQFALIIIMSAIPAVAGDFGYMGYAGYDYIGKLLCVISAYFVYEGINGKKNWLTSVLAIAALACSMGEYQCHLTLFLSIMLVFFIYELLKKDLTWSLFWTKAVYYVGIGIAGTGVYLLVLEIVLKITGLELTSYAGMDSYGIVEVSEYLNRLKTVYEDFFSLDSVAAYSMFPFRWNGWKLLILLAVCGLTIMVILVIALNKKYKKLVQFVVAFCLVPLGMNFNFILYGQSSTHSLHMYQYVMLFMYMIVAMKYIVENGTELLKDKMFERHGVFELQKLTVVVILIFGILYVRYDNMCYMQLEMKQEAAIRYFGTLITRIESTEGYRAEYPVAYLNADQKKNVSDNMYYYYDQPITNPFNMSIINSYNWEQFMEYWCGFDPEEISADEVIDHSEVIKMPHYPDDGSVRVIDGVVVVKF